MAKVQLRGDTAANWTSENTVLDDREFGVETDTLKFKIGDGTTAWASLAYAGGGATSGDDITTGTVADARIAATIARDSEVAAAVAAEALLARNADNLTSGTVADARVAATITRDSELAAAIATVPNVTALPAVTETTDYVLELTDAGGVVEIDASTLTDVTIPPNSSVAFPVGTVIEVYRAGAGTVAVLQGSGVTMVGGEVAITAQYGSVWLRQRDVDEWVITANSGSVVQPGELGAASTAADFTQSGAGNSLVTGLTTTVTTGDRPVYVTLSCKVSHTTTSSAISLSIEQDGTTIVDTSWTCPAGGSFATISRTVRVTPSAGSHVYRVRITTTGTGDGIVRASETSPALLAVEQR